MFSLHRYSCDALLLESLLMGRLSIISVKRSSATIQLLVLLLLLVEVVVLKPLRHRQCVPIALHKLTCCVVRTRPSLCSVSRPPHIARFLLRVLVRYLEMYESTKPRTVSLAWLDGGR